MGYNARNDEIYDNIVRMQREREAQRDALATVRRFNGRPPQGDVELMTEKQILGFEPASRLQNVGDENYERI